MICGRFVVEQAQVALHQEFLHFEPFLVGGAATPQRAMRVKSPMSKTGEGSSEIRERRALQFEVLDGGR
jgi:hypothetical protein